MDSTSDTNRELLSDHRLLLAVSASSVGIFGMQAISPALPSIASALAVSDARIGLVVSAYFFPAMVMVPLAGAFADIFGRRRPIIVGLLLFGLAGTAMTLVDSFRLLLALRVLQGIGLAGIGPIVVTVIGDLYSGPAGAAAQGIRMSGHGVVQILIPAIAGFLAGISWNYPFLLYSLAVPLSVLVAVYLPETGENNGAPTGRLRSELREYVQTLLTESQSWTFRILLIGGFVLNFLRSAIFTFLPLFAVNSLSATAFVAGLLLSLRGGVRIVTSPLSGALVDRLSYKPAILLVVGILTLSAALTATSTTVIQLGVAVTLYSIGEALLLPIINDAVTLFATDEQRGGLVGILSVSRLAASVTGPIFFGAVLSIAGFAVMFGVGGAVTLGYVILVLFFLRAGSIAQGGD